MGDKIIKQSNKRKTTTLNVEPSGIHTVYVYRCRSETLGGKRIIADRELSKRGRKWRHHGPPKKKKQRERNSTEKEQTGL